MVVVVNVAGFFCSIVVIDVVFFTFLDRSFVVVVVVVLAVFIISVITNVFVIVVLHINAIANVVVIISDVFFSVLLDLY